MYKIISKKPLSELVELMVIEAPNVARACQPGQFVMVGVEEDGERIPLTIQDYDREKSTINIIYQVVGYTTAKLQQKQVGEYLPVFLGPLGVPAHYPVDKPKRVVGIGGGVGIAPLFPQMRKLKEEGAIVDVILGGRSADLVILKEEFEAVVDNVFYATNDGSLGIQGLVTDVLTDKLSKEGYDLVVAIGPVVMMRAVVNVTKPLNVPTGVSLNPLMIDGTGMCGGCRVSIDGKTKFACVDGPDFDGFKVDFDEVLRRQSFYKDDEHLCRLKVAK
ncbi:MAG: sulfide/dihydroorotate dehydrogenase-like FAD/NAD-binding protein [Deferribacteraceae bacterium]|jgi:ferredoxin--NADP+ reductase|nr:sulfide/dihydroorotate dehydrogenase-like FAD/NAD-binding protein [Deferribacteraceae bacterium]